MKSRISILLALLMVLSVGFIDAALATDVDEGSTQQVAVSGKEKPCTDEGGAGATGETQGDPDGWLGGQNLRPVPPATDGEDSQSSGDLGSLLQEFYAALLKLVSLD